MSEHGRPYWLHQVAEYIVGFILLLAVSRVDGAERVPLIIGGALVLVNAAISGPPAGMPSPRAPAGASLDGCRCDRGARRDPRGVP